MTDPENHIIRLLQEIQTNMNQQFGDIKRQLDEQKQSGNERFNKIKEQFSFMESRLDDVESTVRFYSG